MIHNCPKILRNAMTLIERSIIFIFFNNEKLEYVCISQYVKYIQFCVFYQHLSLKSISVPDSITYLQDHESGEEVFAMCENLVKVNCMNSAVTSI